MKAVMVARARQAGKTAMSAGMTALELAAGKSGSIINPGSSKEVLCDGCGNIKRLHGVWVFQKWFCPFCVRQLGVTLQ